MEARLSLDCRVYRLSVDAEVIYMSDKSPSGWADSTTSLDAENLLWKQYIVYVDLFKVYVDNALRPCIWFYAITGALLSFYIDHIGSGQPYLPYALLFPMLFSIGFCIGYLRSARQVEELRIRFDYIQEQLRLPGRPHVEFLSGFLRLAGVLFGLVGIALLVVFVFGVT
jgi:hypothetical protein